MRKAAFEDFLDRIESMREGPVDLFDPTDSPRDLAISRVITLAVENWIGDDMDSAYLHFRNAGDYMNAPADHFQPEGD